MFRYHIAGRCEVIPQLVDSAARDQGYCWRYAQSYQMAECRQRWRRPRGGRCPAACRIGRCRTAATFLVACCQGFPARLHNATTTPVVVVSSLFQLIKLPGCPLPYVIVVASVYQPVKGTPLRSDPVTSAGVAQTDEDTEPRWSTFIRQSNPLPYELPQRFRRQACCQTQCPS